RRFLAFGVDTLVQGVVVIAALVVALALAPAGIAGTLAIALFLLVPLLVSVGYFAVAEALTAGRTPGKRALGLRVIRLDGGAPGLREALVRNIVRIIDLALGNAEWGALRTFLSRPGMAPDQRARLAAVIAERLCERLGLAPGAPERQWPPELLLERLYLQLLPRMAPAPPGHGMPV